MTDDDKYEKDNVDESETWWHIISFMDYIQGLNTRYSYMLLLYYRARGFKLSSYLCKVASELNPAFDYTRYLLNESLEIDRNWQE